MSERLSLMVDQDVPGLLTQLAGGERRRGEYVSKMARAIYENDRLVAAGADVEALRLAITGMASRLIAVEGRLLATERQLAALIAAEQAPAAGG